MDTSDQVASENYNRFMKTLETLAKTSGQYLKEFSTDQVEKINEYREELANAKDQMAQLRWDFAKAKGNMQQANALSLVEGMIDHKTYEHIKSSIENLEMPSLDKAPEVLGKMDAVTNDMRNVFETYLRAGRPEQVREAFNKNIEKTIESLSKKPLEASKKPLEASKSIIGKSIDDILKQAATKPLKTMTKAVVKDMSDDFGLVR